MVGTYLVCDVCGKFGPPAGFISKDGMRLCYQCVYEESEGRQKRTVEESDKKARAEVLIPDDGDS